MVSFLTLCAFFFICHVFYAFVDFRFFASALPLQSEPRVTNFTLIFIFHVLLAVFYVDFLAFTPRPILLIWTVLDFLEEPRCPNLVLVDLAAVLVGVILQTPGDVLEVAPSSLYVGVRRTLAACPKGIFFEAFHFLGALGAQADAGQDGQGEIFQYDSWLCHVY